jgi:glycine cleavage system aminomethyltransferase T
MEPNGSGASAGSVASAPAGSPQTMDHSRWVPFDPSVHLYIGNTFPHAVPYEHTGWREETMAWKESCYLNGNLNPSPTYRIKGRQALEFLKSVCVNSFANFPVGSGKHAICCNETGLIMMDGVVVRLAEDDFITYWITPYLDYALTQSKLEAKGEDLTGQAFLFQLAGPRSLAVAKHPQSLATNPFARCRHRLGSRKRRPLPRLRDRGVRRAFLDAE